VLRLELSKPLEIFSFVYGSFALRIISLSSCFAFGDFANFSILLMSFPDGSLTFSIVGASSR